MSRAVIVINGNYDRERAANWAKSAAPGMIIEFRQSKRTLDQNARLWACLTEIARTVDWHGIKLTPDDWKDVFTAALRRHRFVPGLEAGTVVPLGMRTSDMTKQEFGDLLELINAFAAERGIVFRNEQEPSDEPSPASSDEGAEVSPPPSAPDEPAAQSSDPLDERAWLIGFAKAIVAAIGPDEAVVVNQSKGLFVEGLSEDTRKKARSATSYARAACRGDTERGDAIEMIAGIAGCDPREIA